MDRRQKLGARVRAWRQSAGMLSSELADKVGVQRATISYLENGKLWTSRETLEGVARVFGITVEELLSGISTPEEHAPQKGPRRRTYPPRSRDQADGTCTNRVCKNQEAIELADFLGHDVTGHKALNALIGYTHVRTPTELRELTQHQLRCIPNVGDKTTKRIRECMTRTAKGLDPVRTSVVTEMLEGDRIYGIRVTMAGFTAVVSPDGENWYEVEATLRMYPTEAPKTFHVWEESG